MFPLFFPFLLAMSPCQRLLGRGGRIGSRVLLLGSILPLLAPPGLSLGQEAARTGGAKRPQAAAKGKPKVVVPGIDLAQLPVRSLGPAVMGGRVVALAVNERRPVEFYVATASGGIWKTVNNGTTFEPLFQHENTVSLGALAMAPSDPRILWAGTGEANNRNSTAWGDGVYKSTDGGRTWKNMGLCSSRHIGRIAIHPKNPDIVFVAACGSLWGPGGERGLFRTKDGGKTWECVLKGDEETGATEVRIDPKEPRFVYAALYERQRDRFDGSHPAKRWGPGSGLWRSEDGGDSWTECTEGLPTVDKGRISLDIWRKDPRVIWALVETSKIGTAPKDSRIPEQPGYMGIQGEDGPGGARLTEVVKDGPAAKAGFATGDLVVEFGGKTTSSYEEMIAILREMKAGRKVSAKVVRKGKVLDLEMKLGTRPGMRNRRRKRLPFTDRIGGQIANMQGRQGPKGFETGGIFRSEDRGRTWKRVNSLNPRPYYFSQIRVDPSDEKYVYVCGISFHYSKTRGKTFAVTAREVHVDFHAMWIDPNDGRRLLLGCDGGVNLSRDRGKTWEIFENFDIGQAYHAVADTRRPYWVYAGYQDNGSWGGPSRTRRREGLMNLDWFKIGSGDGFVCRVDRDDPDIVFYESQRGNIRWVNVITGVRGRVRKPKDSWNWNTPFLLSRFNSRVLYFAGTKVYRSPDRGRSIETISGRIVRSKPNMKTPLGAPSAKPSASALAESPRKPGILWVGTDDGALHVTRDGGRNWKAVHESLRKAAGTGDYLWVSYVHPSRFADGRAYVALDGHRMNDFRPHAFATEDFGKSWRVLSSTLPEGSVHCLVEDTKNQDLLYLGTETGLWISLDRGESWKKLPPPFPTVAVRDLDIQEREEDLILATHGRSIWILDVAPLRALTPALRKKDVALLPISDVLRLRSRSLGRQGHRYFAVPNPKPRARFYVYRREISKKPLVLTVHDEAGSTVWRKELKAVEGLQRVDWDLRRRSARGSRKGRRRSARVPAGIYRVVLESEKGERTRFFRIEDDTGPMDVSWPRPRLVGEGAPVPDEIEEEGGSTGFEGGIR